MKKRVILFHALFLLLILPGCQSHDGAFTPEPNSTDSAPILTDSTTPLPGENAPFIFISQKASVDMFDLSEFDRALCEGALSASTAQSNEKNHTAIIPQIGVYGQYLEDGRLYVICSCEYVHCYNLDPAAADYNFSEFGISSGYGLAVLIENSDGSYTCESFELTGDGDELEQLKDICGPLTDLPDQIVDGDVVPVCTFPSVYDMLTQYFEFLL